jgi:hypothetical protein
MKFKVAYKRVKKKKTVSLEATFFKMEDAFHWEQYVKEQGYQDVEVLPVF